MDQNLTDKHFDLVCPAGRMRCRWLDPALGLFVPEGADGFLTLRDAAKRGLWIENMETNETKDGTTQTLPSDP